MRRDYFLLYYYKMATRDNIFNSQGLVSGVSYYPMMKLRVGDLQSGGVSTDLEYKDGTLTINGDLAVSQVNTGNPKVFSTYDVKYYGAKGDGVADDTLAIQRAIDANGDYLYFPQGFYLVSDTLLISGKTDMTIQGSGATIRTSASGKSAIHISGCTNVIVGNLGFEGVVGLTGASCMRVSGSSGTYLRDIDIQGGYIQGNPSAIRIETGLILEANPLLQTSSVENPTIEGCKRAIVVSGDYYSISNPQIDACSEYAIRITGSYNTINGGQILACLMGVLVEGGIGNKLVFATLNHDNICAVFLKNTQSFLMTGCDIWATIGTYPFGVPDGFTPNTFEYAIAEEARQYQYGIYIENSQCVCLTKNSISRNNVGIGIDGMSGSVISDNSFLSADGYTICHIVYFGANLNFENIYTSNSFYASYLPLSPYQQRCIAFPRNATTNSREIVKGSVGTTMQGNEIILGNNTFYLDSNRDYYIIDTSLFPIIYFLPSLAGTSFSVSFYRSDGNAFGSHSISLVGYTGSTLPKISGTGCSYNNGSKAYSFSKTGTYRFTAYGTGVNDWFIQCPIEAP